MKYFLAKFTITDGTHEHGDQFLVKANTFDAAWQIALKEQHEVGSDEAKTYWDYGDGLTASSLISIEEVIRMEAEMLNRLGVAHFINWFSVLVLKGGHNKIS